MLAVEIQHLNKTFQLYSKPIQRLKEAIFRRQYHQKFVALDDVSFQVHSGETLGIVGDNGAGKSTLLKILARTLTPTSGQVKINGKVSALLELGAGFHSEFTGRQNIFLNASLQGLSEKDTKDKEDEIIDFAELGQFIDRPIKTYSSGMIVRLAFSIATCVDPDILIIDEALSVGDQYFQQKCVNRMIDFREKGKTIILCSHSMYLINELSSKAIWLDRGLIHRYDQTSKVISDYFAYQENRSQKNDIEQTEDQVAEIEETNSESSDAPNVIITDILVKNEKNKLIEVIYQFQKLIIQIQTKQIRSAIRGQMAILLQTEDNMDIFGTITKSKGKNPILFENEKVVEMHIHSIPIQRGCYKFHAILGDEHALRVIHEYTSSVYNVLSEHPEYGMVHFDHYWNV